MELVISSIRMTRAKNKTSFKINSVINSAETKNFVKIIKFPNPFLSTMHFNKKVRNDI